MSKTREKFIAKQDAKRRHQLEEVIADIQAGKIDLYDIKPLEGISNMIRIRHRNTRILCSINISGGYDIIDIDFRGDVYKTM